MNQISISIPTYCRTEMLIESFGNVLGDDRIREVVISDDCSPNRTFEDVSHIFSGHPKIKLFQNAKNLDCYRNKKKAVELSTSEWTILLDDDNILGTDYLDTIYRIKSWDPKTIYCPDFAKPHFNYTRYAGMTFDKSLVWRMVHLPHFKTALNTSNYFIHRSSWLEVWDGSIDPVTVDTLFHAYNWLRKGYKIAIVPGLRYFHRVHENSHYKKNWRRTGNLAVQLDNKLRNLR